MAYNGYKYKYHMKGNGFDAFLSKEEIDIIISKKLNISEDEKFILNVYESSNNEGIVTSEEKNFNI